MRNNVRCTRTAFAQRSGLACHMTRPSSALKSGRRESRYTKPYISPCRIRDTTCTLRTDTDILMLRTGAQNHSSCQRHANHTHIYYRCCRQYKPHICIHCFNTWTFVWWKQHSLLIHFFTSSLRNAKYGMRSIQQHDFIGPADSLTIPLKKLWPRTT